MSYVFAVHESQSLQDLLHELNGLTLQQVLLLSNEVKQLSSTDTEMSNRSVCVIVMCFSYFVPPVQAMDKVAKHIIQ